jgi:hypothetical protein
MFSVFDHMIEYIVQFSIYVMCWAWTNDIIQSVQDVTGSEFELFMGFLRSLSIFGDSAPRESFQELIEIIQAQADLNSQFNVSMLCEQYWNQIYCMLICKITD